jgi:hypothetical protein
MKSPVFATHAQPSYELWEAFGASVTGQGHLHQNQPGQDRYATFQWIGKDPASRLLVIGCADGAGSAAKSWAGAWMGCRAVIQAIQERLQTSSGESSLIRSEGWTEAYIKRLFDQSRRRIQRWSSTLNATPADLATTMNLAVIGHDFGCFAQVGDGLIGYQLQASPNLWELANQPDQGEFAGETTFLTSPNWLDQMRIRMIREPLGRVFVSTDGLLPVILDQSSGQIHTRFVNPLFTVLENPAMPSDLKKVSLGQFLQSDRIKSRCDDDLTLILANRSQVHVDAGTNGGYIIS